MSPPRQQPVALVGDELARALRGVPSKPDIVAIAALLSAEAVRSDPKATYELGWKFCTWLRKATHTVLSVAELHSVADVIVRAQLFDVLREFAVAGKRREPKERLWRFYEIVARTTNNPDQMYVAEEDEIRAMCNSPTIHKDRHGSGRIDRYLDSSGDDPGAKQRARRKAGLDPGDLELLETILAAFMSSISKRDVQRLVRSHGRDGAVTALADRLAQLEFGASAPRPLLEMVAGGMVAAALGEASPPFGTSPYGGGR